MNPPSVGALLHVPVFFTHVLFLEPGGVLKSLQGVQQSAFCRLFFQVHCEVRVTFSLCRLACSLQCPIQRLKIVVCCVLFSFRISAMSPCSVVFSLHKYFAYSSDTVSKLIFLGACCSKFVSCFISSNPAPCRNPL